MSYISEGAIEDYEWEDARARNDTFVDEYYVSNESNYFVVGEDEHVDHYYLAEDEDTYVDDYYVSNENIYVVDYEDEYENDYEDDEEDYGWVDWRDEEYLYFQEKMVEAWDDFENYGLHYVEGSYDDDVLRALGLIFR